MDGVRIAAICCLAVMFSVALIMGYDTTEMWASMLGLIALIAGGGTAIKNTVKHILRIG